MDFHTRLLHCLAFPVKTHSSSSAQELWGSGFRIPDYLVAPFWGAGTSVLSCFFVLHFVWGVQGKPKQKPTSQFSMRTPVIPSALRRSIYATRALPPVCGFHGGLVFLTLQSWKLCEAFGRSTGLCQVPCQLINYPPLEAMALGRLCFDLFGRIPPLHSWKKNCKL